jgi:glutamyl-tRNA synthetase
MQGVPLERKCEACLPFLVEAGLLASPVSDADRRRVAAVLTAAGDRLRIAGDVLEYADFFLPDEQLTYDEAAFEKRLRRPPGAAELLARYRDRLAAAPTWTAPELEASMHAFVAAEAVTIGNVIHALRVAATGRAVGFGMFETLELLGRERTLRRIEHSLARANAPAAAPQATEERS